MVTKYYNCAMAIKQPRAASGETTTSGSSLLEASRVASSYFETKFDRTLLHHAYAHCNVDWLLSDNTHPAEPLGGLFSELFPPDSEGRYVFLIPKDSIVEGEGTRSATYELQVQELHQVVRELVGGIYVFNQIPVIDFEPNYDFTTTCSIPSSYHDTLIGTNLFAVNYFVHSLLNGSTIPQKDKRMHLLENWKKFSHSNLKKMFIANGMTTIQEDKEIGKDIYVKKKVPFIRCPPKCVHTEITYSQLTQHLTMDKDYEQQASSIGRDVFLQHLDHITIGIVFRQERILHGDNIFVLNPASDVVTGVMAMDQGTDSSLYNHLHSYLQKQREFVTENLFKKSDIAHSMNLLSFVSFMIYFLVTLKKHNKIIDVSNLLPSKSIDATRTDREIPPVLPSPLSRWSPYLSENNYAAIQGGINFMKTCLLTELPRLSIREMITIKELQTPKKSSISSITSFTSSQHMMNSGDGDVMSVCEVGGKSYFAVQFQVEPYYLNTPKLPRWVHAMKAELKSQFLRLPPINNTRIHDMLRKPLSTHKTVGMTVNILLKGCVEKGLLPAVRALLKRCTQTRLGKADDNGMAMIHYAAANARPQVISALIIAGSSVNQPICLPNQLPTRTLPVHLAAKSGSLDTLSCLDSYGADMWVEDDNGWMPVHYASFNNYQLMIRQLLYSNQSKIDVKTSGKLHATPLLLAAKNGCFDSFKYLVELGANLDVTMSNGCTVVHLAALGNHITILKYLIDLGKKELNVWMMLSDMLMPLDGPCAKAAARCLDPLTQWKPEGSSELLKHSAIKSLVQLLCKDQTSSLLVVQVLANLSNLNGVKLSLILSEAIPHLVQLLTSSNGRIQVCACLVLSDLAMQPDTQITIVAAGAIPLLTKLLQSKANDVQLFSCACIGILAYDNPKNQNLVSEAKAIPILVSMLKSCLSCIKGCAADSLQRILYRNRSNQLSALDKKIIPPLILMLRCSDASIQKSAARVIEFLAADCEEGQCELLTDSMCITLLKRMLKMRDPSLKMRGSCALWAIAGILISNKCLIASHMGLEPLVYMLTIHNEKLDFVCSEALGSLATELGENQNIIINVGGVKTLVKVLTISTSQKVCLSVIHTLSAICMKRALVPNYRAQKAIASSRGISILASIVTSSQAAEIVRVESACMLAKLVLNNVENDTILTKHTDFSYTTIFKFLVSSELTVRLLAGYCLAIMAFNNPLKVSVMKSHDMLHISNFDPFLQSDDQFYHVHSAFQIVVLSKVLAGIKSVDAVIQGIKLLVSLVSSETEQTKVLSTEFAASLSRMGEGIPGTLVIAGILEPLMDNLRTNNSSVIESSSVALGYLTFNSTASRIILSIFRNSPELFDIFRNLFPLVVYSPKFLTLWTHMTRPGLPSLR